MEQPAQAMVPTPLKLPAGRLKKEPHQSHTWMTTLHLQALRSFKLSPQADLQASRRVVERAIPSKGAHQTGTNLMVHINFCSAHPRIILPNRRGTYLIYPPILSFKSRIVSSLKSMTDCLNAPLTLLPSISFPSLWPRICKKDSVSP